MNRTELLVLLTPRVIGDPADARAVDRRAAPPAAQRQRRCAPSGCASAMRAMTSARRRGIALILVLWIAGLLAVIAASLVSSSRTEARLARNLIENAKAEALADGAVHRAVLGLLELDPRPRLAGRRQSPR